MVKTDSATEKEEDRYGPGDEWPQRKTAVFCRLAFWFSSGFITNFLHCLTKKTTGVSTTVQWAKLTHFQAGTFLAARHLV